MDPITQMFQQQQGASAEGQGFGQFFVEGVRSGQEQQKINLSKRRLELEEQQQSALLSLQQKAAQLQNQNTGIEIQSKLAQIENFNQQNSAMPAIYQLQIDAARSEQGYGDPEIINRAAMMMSQYPKAFASGPGAEVRQSLKADPMFKSEIKNIIEMQSKLSEAGLQVQQYNPKTGSIEFMRSSPTGLQLVNPDGTVNQGLMDQFNQAAPPGQVFKSYNPRTGQVTYGSPPSNETIETMPDGTVRISRGAGGAKGPSVANKNKAEESALKGADIVDYANNVIKYAEGNTGVLGVLKRKYVELGGQVTDVKPGTEFEYSTAAALLRAAVIHELRSDSAINKDEVKRLEKAVPSIDAIESAASAKEKASKMMRMVAPSARRRAERAGVELPLQLMKPDEIIKKWALGKLPGMTTQEVRDAAKNSPFAPE